jgi:amino acid transporter
MTEVQESGGRTRWFRRGNGEQRATTGAPHEHRSGPGSHVDEPVHADGADLRKTDTLPVERDPEIGSRRRAADQANLRERFGGRKVGAAFFGWLVAVGMTVMLSTIATAVGVAIGSSMNLDPSGADAAPVGLTGGAVLLVVLGVSYFTGGYVAGRLARFDGARNGLLAWIVGLLVTVVAAVTGMVAGAANAELFGSLRLPALPGDVTELTVAGVIALAAVLLVTALAAALGGRVGEQFHRRVDRAAERI